MTSTHHWQVVHLQDAQITPWRNGGGTTRELVAWPNTQNWQWRVSVAEVARSGPFSSFSGVRRWFAVLEGEGVCLKVAGAPHTLDSNANPLEFDGAAQTTCELLGGGTQDFNLMVNTGKSALLQRIKGTMNSTLSAHKIIAVYAHKTGASVRFGHKNYDLPPFSFGWVAVDTLVAVCVTASNALFMEIDG